MFGSNKGSSHRVTGDHDATKMDTVKASHMDLWVISQMLYTVYG